MPPNTRRLGVIVNPPEDVMGVAVECKRSSKLRTLVSRELRFRDFGPIFKVNRTDADATQSVWLIPRDVTFARSRSMPTAPGFADGHLGYLFDSSTFRNHK